MSQLVLKAVVSGLLIAAASEAARRSPAVGAILISLPLTSILALIWLYRDTGDPAAVRSLSWSILLMVIPSAVFFIALPLLISAGWPVPTALLAAAALTAAGYPLWVIVARKLGLPIDG